jgi:hypothetical protein
VGFGAHTWPASHPFPVEPTAQTKISSCHIDPTVIAPPEAEHVPMFVGMAGAVIRHDSGSIGPLKFGIGMQFPLSAVFVVSAPPVHVMVS